MVDGSGGIRMGTFTRLGPVAALMGALACGPAVAAAPPCDFFCYMTAANKASLVMLDERGLLLPALARQIAAGIDQVAAEQEQPGARRWTNYLDFEERLLDQPGRKWWSRTRDGPLPRPLRVLGGGRGTAHL